MSPPRIDLLASLSPITKALRRMEDETAARHGITMWQYATLSVLSDTPGLNQGQVAKVLQYSANRLVADLDDLQQRGLTIRQPGDDRRSNHLFATKAGMDLKERVQHDVHAREDELLAPLTVNRQRQLRAALQDLARQLRLGRLSDEQ